MMHLNGLERGIQAAECTCLGIRDGISTLPSGDHGLDNQIEGDRRHTPPIRTWKEERTKQKEWSFGSSPIMVRAESYRRRHRRNRFAERIGPRVARREEIRHSKRLPAGCERSCSTLLHHHHRFPSSSKLQVAVIDLTLLTVVIPLSHIHCPARLLTFLQLRTQPMTIAAGLPANHVYI